MDRTYRIERGRITGLEYGSGEPVPPETLNTFSLRSEFSGLYLPEAVNRFESAEPLDRLVVLS